MNITVMSITFLAAAHLLRGCTDRLKAQPESKETGISLRVEK